MIKWIECENVQDLHKQIEEMAYTNGRAEDVLENLAAHSSMDWEDEVSGEVTQVLCLITKYAGATEAEEVTRVMAPVLSQAREYSREIDPETGEIYGWQEVGDFLTFHESKAGHWRYNAVCLTRHAEDPEDCRRGQRLDRIGAVLLNATPHGLVDHDARSLTVRNRI